MNRGLWFVAGAGAGVYVVVRARRAAEVLTADGLRDRWNGVTLGARMLREEVVSAQAEKETELRERFGLVPHGTPEIEGGRHRAGAEESGTRPAVPPLTAPTMPNRHPEEEGNT